MQPEWTHCKELPVQQQREHREKWKSSNMAELEGVALQGVSKVRSDFFFTYISMIIKDNFCKPKHVIHYSFNIE